jgi:hypothetical protein
VSDREWAVMECEDVDGVILGYLLHRAAKEEGSERAIAKGAGLHAYVTTQPFNPQAAKARSDAAEVRVRELLAKSDRAAPSAPMDAAGDSSKGRR